MGLVGVEVFFLYGVRDIFVVCDWVGATPDLHRTRPALRKHNVTRRSEREPLTLAMTHACKSFDINEGGPGDPPNCIYCVPGGMSTSDGATMSRARGPVPLRLFAAGTNCAKRTGE